MPNKKKRVLSIDILRGIIMALMALDHTRDYFHIQAAVQDPTDLQSTTPILFFTRFITHYCAPTFVFLSGVSVYLQSLRKTGAELSVFLFTRGLWLVFMELTFVNFGWSFNIHFDFLFLQVIWAIGWSMVILSLLVLLHYWIAVVTGFCLVFLHNLSDIYIPENESLKTVSNFLIMTDFTLYDVLGIKVISAYAVLPWTGIMLLGFGAGKWFDTTKFNTLKRRSRLVYSGLLLITLFVILRLINGYGDPNPWISMRTNTYTLLSYLNVTKYPPSLMYTCITLGPALLVLAVLEKQPFNWFLKAMNTLGRVPFFYYLLHIYVIHLLCVVLYFMSGFTWSQLYSLPQMFAFRPREHFGFPLGYVYLVWIGVVTFCYFPCRWYDRYKSTHKKWWLSYL